MNNRNLIISLVVGIVLATIAVVIVLLTGNNEPPSAKKNTDYPVGIQTAISNPAQSFDSWSNLFETEEYIIAYSNVPKDTFSIIVNSSPVLEISKQAEQAFLSKLNISTEYACTLNLIIKVPLAVDEKLSQYSFEPSFCTRQPRIEDVLK